MSTPSGSARMGPPNDPGAVVDQHGRVHGTSGLRIADFGNAHNSTCEYEPDLHRDWRTGGGMDARGGRLTRIESGNVMTQIG